MTLVFEYEDGTFLFKVESDTVPRVGELVTVAALEYRVQQVRYELHDKRIPSAWLKVVPNRDAEP